MSLFAPMDVRGPDQRRKQLMQKLAQQGRRAVPMPQQAGQRAPVLGEGRSFLGGLARPMSTHGGNVLSSILARLGVGGQPGAGEFSGGQGQPISHSMSGGGADPYSRAPSPITGGHAIGPSDPTMLPPVPSAGGGPFQSPPVSGGFQPLQAAGPGPGLPTGVPANGGGMVAPGLSGLFGGPVPQGGGLIDLGNGMFYDPAADKVVGAPAPSGGGSLYTKSY